MVKLSRLASVCKNRLIARSIPEQATCRLLGNEESNCIIDPFCQAVDQHGLGLFYLFFAVFSCIVFLITYWLFRLTKVFVILIFLLNLILPPTKWLIRTVIAIKEFINSLSE